MTEIKFNVLIAEDEENIGNFISTILKTNGYKPIIATTGNQGTETSKYPEEEKENLSISKVAASEMERAQTGVRAFRGSDRIIDSVNPAELFWESRPERVKVP